MIGDIIIKETEAYVNSSNLKHSYAANELIKYSINSKGMVDSENQFPATLARSCKLRKNDSLLKLET